MMLWEIVFDGIKVLCNDQQLLTSYWTLAAVHVLFVMFIPTDALSEV